jgi:hypothetical protein
LEALEGVTHLELWLFSLDLQQNPVPILELYTQFQHIEQKQMTANKIQKASNSKPDTSSLSAHSTCGSSQGNLQGRGRGRGGRGGNTQPHRLNQQQQHQSQSADEDSHMIWCPYHERLGSHWPSECSI